jgi:hypothetical protein
MSFTPFDPLPASDLNDMVENIEALAAGTGLDNSAVIGAKIANYRIPYQTDNNGSIASATGTAIIVQAGWGQMTGAGANTMNETVTFPAAFTTILGVVCTPIGAKAVSNAATITELVSAAGGPQDWGTLAYSFSTTGFSVEMNRHVQSGGANTNFTSGTRYAYSWFAWGL